MRRRRNGRAGAVLAAALALFVLYPAPGGAVDTWKPGAAAPDDATLARNVESRITGRPVLDVSRVTVTVRRGVLDLGGSVSTIFERREVERLASSVRGLVSIENRIAVARREAGDAALEQEVARTISLSPRLQMSGIRVAVKDASVTLEGEVGLARDREDAEDAACRVPGVVAVENRLRVAPAPVDPDLIRRRIERLLSNKLVFSGVADLKVTAGGDGAVSLSGSVATHADRLRAERIAYGVRGVVSVRNELTVLRLHEQAD